MKRYCELAVQTAMGKAERDVRWQPVTSAGWLIPRSHSSPSATGCEHKQTNTGTNLLQEISY